jgi:hypothetical protein
MKNIFGAFFGFIFGVVFAAIGFCVVYFFGLPIVTQAKASLEWPQVSGVITSSRVQSRRDNDGTVYSSEVTYDYTVDGKKMSGETVYFGDNVSSSSRTTASETVSKYPTGKEIQVYYSPESPDECVIEPGTTWSSYFVLILGSIFGVVGLLVALGTGFTLFGGGLAILGGAAGLLASKRRDTPQNFGMKNTPRSQMSPQVDNSSRYNQPSVDGDHDDGFDIT